MNEQGYNIYFQPESFGLLEITELEYSDTYGHFDTRVVWKQLASGKLFTARDSGCSCPTPFETYSLENIDIVDIDELRREIDLEISRDNTKPEIAQEFLNTVRMAIKESATNA